MQEVKAMRKQAAKVMRLAAELELQAVELSAKMEELSDQTVGIKRTLSLTYRK